MKNLIGNTPIAKIKIKISEKIKYIYAKLEYFSLTGSIKDRLAYFVITRSYEDGSLKIGMPIVEATSGNTGISFSALGAYYGHPVHIFMPDWVSEERKKIMEMYGSKVYLVSKEEGGFDEAIKRADNLAKEINGFRPNQFSNILNTIAHYEGTGKEIIDKVSQIDAFVSGFGTGGTLMGISKRIKEKFPLARTIAMEPDSMTLLSKEVKFGSHRIDGIGDDFLPELVDASAIDEVVTISDEEAINMSRRLSRELGVGVGISAGGNFFASAITEGEHIVTIFADDLKKYISTDLSKEKKVMNLVSDSIEFVGLEIL